jgi:hypothetical protein
MRQIILRSVLLLQKYLRVQSIPPPRPILIGPAQAERKIGLSALPHLVYWAFQNPASMEPVMEIAETIESIVRGQFLTGTCIYFNQNFHSNSRPLTEAPASAAKLYAVQSVAQDGARFVLGEGQRPRPVAVSLA